MKNLWVNWKKLAEKSGNAQASFIFSLLFFVIVTPCGLFLRLFRDSLTLKKDPVWKAIVEDYGTKEAMKEQ